MIFTEIVPSTENVYPANGLPDNPAIEQDEAEFNRAVMECGTVETAEEQDIRFAQAKLCAAFPGRTVYLASVKNWKCAGGSWSEISTKWEAGVLNICAVSDSPMEAVEKLIRSIGGGL